MTRKMKILHILPRAICIAAILFISLFALDSFEEGKSITDQILAFIIHLIPSFTLLLFLLIAWKYELTGGIIFCIIGIVFTPVLYKHNHDMNESVWLTVGILSSLTLPFFTVGILFILSYFHKKRIK